MDHIDPIIGYDIALGRHREDAARGEAAQRLATAVGTRPLRVRVATAALALARRLDPASRPLLRQGAAPSLASPK